MGMEQKDVVRTGPRGGRPRRTIPGAAIRPVPTPAPPPPPTAGITSISMRPLPPDRLGTVVGWQHQSQTAVVALTSGRLMTIHSLRRQRAGTRVRVNGIKWGTPTSGIKWGRAPLGIKWGIKWARNGTYQSGLRATKPTTRVRIRGVVVKRYPGAVAIGTRGGLVVVRQAVWLPRTRKGTKSLDAVRPAVGDLVTTNVRIVGPQARLYGDGVRVIPTSGPLPIPTGGTLIRSASKGTIRIRSTVDPAYTVITTMKVPGGVDVSAIRPGTAVSATATLNADNTLRVAQLAPDTSFAVANDPARQIVAPPSAPAASIALIDEAISQWNLAAAEGQVSDATVAASGLAFLRQARTAAADGRWDSAAIALDEFQQIVENGYGTTVDASVVATQISLISVIQMRLGA